MSDPQLILASRGVEIRKYVFGEGDKRVEIPVFANVQEAAHHGGPIDVLVFVLIAEIEQLKERCADLERIVVAGPGWVPVGGLPNFNACKEAGVRLFDRVQRVDAEAITRPIDPAELG